MPGSYKDVDFSLRPAKCIERKMLCETLQRLRPFGRLDMYRYIGFGSIYFVDFVLFHRLLGITDMISIESEVDDRPRFEFNRPFGFVDIKYGKSTDVLPDPDLEWSSRSIVWLDYDDPLEPYMLDDLKHLVQNVVPGSVLILTVDARSPKYPGTPQAFDDDLAAWRDTLSETLGDKLPADVEPRVLADWGTARVYRRIIDAEIRHTLDDFNWGRAPNASLRYEQLFNFHYRDTARMLTVGGLLYEEGQRHLVEQCGFGELEFIKTGQDAFLIEVPRLTHKERRMIDHQLLADQAQALADLEHPGLDEDDLERYVKYCRYFPTFAETEL